MKREIVESLADEQFPTATVLVEYDDGRTARRHVGPDGATVREYPLRRETWEAAVRRLASK